MFSFGIWTSFEKQGQGHQRAKTGEPSSLFAFLEPLSRYDPWVLMTKKFGVPDTMAYLTSGSPAELSVRNLGEPTSLKTHA
jgi:hypothetical protein